MSNDTLPAYDYVTLQADTAKRFKRLRCWQERHHHKCMCFFVYLPLLALALAFARETFK